LTAAAPVAAADDGCADGPLDFPDSDGVPVAADTPAAAATAAATRPAPAESGAAEPGRRRRSVCIRNRFPLADIVPARPLAGDPLPACGCAFVASLAISRRDQQTERKHSA
jgi:hypothetical protein